MKVPFVVVSLYMLGSLFRHHRPIPQTQQIGRTLSLLNDLFLQHSILIVPFTKRILTSCNRNDRNYPLPKNSKLFLSAKFCCFFFICLMRSQEQCINACAGSNNDLISESKTFIFWWEKAKHLISACFRLYKYISKKQKYYDENLYKYIFRNDISKKQKHYDDYFRILLKIRLINSHPVLNLNENQKFINLFIRNRKVRLDQYVHKAAKYSSQIPHNQQQKK